MFLAESKNNVKHFKACRYFLKNMVIDFRHPNLMSPKWYSDI